jgi:hypothetical protein
MNNTKRILICASTVFLASTQSQANVPLVTNALRGLLADELIKGGVKVAVDGMQKLLPAIRNGMTPPPVPSLAASIEQTYYRFDRTYQYPHQPLVRERFELRSLASGMSVDYRVWTNNVLGFSETRPLKYYRDRYDKDPASLPAWMRLPLLHHLQRKCDLVLDQVTYPDRSDETYELVVRCRGVNWPRQSPPGRAYVSVEVPQEILFNRCLPAETQISVGSEAMPAFRRNGELLRDLYPDLAMVLDPTGAGYSAPIQPKGLPNRIEPNGLPPIIRRCALTPTPISTADSL